MKNKRLIKTKNNGLKEAAVYALFAAILYAFYHSAWAFIALAPACVIYHRYNRKKRAREERDLLAGQFKDALQAITAALRAGYSMESAIAESREEMRTLHGENSPIYGALTKIINEMSLGVSASEAISKFANESGAADIVTFASVFSIAKRSGGDLVEIINKTSDDISAKTETKEEIAVAVSSKRLEQRVMSAMPLAIILYISLFSPDIIAPLYGSATGVLIMTGCLALYALAYFLSARIMNIEV